MLELIKARVHNMSESERKKVAHRLKNLGELEFELGQKDTSYIFQLLANYVSKVKTPEKGNKESSFTERFIEASKKFIQSS